MPGCLAGHRSPAACPASASPLAASLSYAESGLPNLAAGATQVVECVMEIVHAGKARGEAASAALH